MKKEKKEIPATRITASLENISNFHLDVVSLHMTISMYNDVAHNMDADQLRNALKIITEKSKFIGFIS